MAVAVAERRVNSLADAEEIAAAAFRVAWQRHADGEELSVPWLYGVLRNLIGNEYRRRKRQAALLERIEENVLPDGGGSDWDAVHLRAVVGALPAQHREVIEMAYWDDLDVPTIAAVRELSVGAVHTRLSRARAALRSALEESERGERDDR